MSAHKTLAEALLAFQADAPKLRTNDTAKIPTKGGGEYSYKYLTLDRLIDEITPVLHKHGLVWSSKPGGTHAEPTLRYTLTHIESGEKDEGEMPLYLGGAATAQAHGSSISYARRYAQLAALNLVAEDDDGKKASQPRQAEPQPHPALVAAAAGLTVKQLKQAHSDTRIPFPSGPLFVGLTDQDAAQLETALLNQRTDIPVDPADFAPPANPPGEDAFERALVETFDAKPVP